MKTKLKIEKSITLTLNEEEARYLNALTQNFLGSKTDKEDELARKIRVDLFNETYNLLHK